MRPPKKELSRKEEKSEKVQEVPDLLPMSWTASYIPLKQVKNGIIQTSDNRFVKIVEVLPINFLYGHLQNREVSSLFYVIPENRTAQYPA